MVLHSIRNRLRLAQTKRHLIQAGHDVNAYNKSGWTPLLRAAYHGDVEVARELIRAKADVHLKVKGPGRTALHVTACYLYQMWLMCCTLMKYFGLSSNDDEIQDNEKGDGKRAAADMYWKPRGCGRTALHVAADYGHQTLVKLFLETSIGINEQDDEGRTALVLATQRGHSAVVAELVRAGADVSLKDKKGMSAVLLARNYDIVCQLGRNVDCLSREDRVRILWHACDAGDLSMVKSIIEAGCDVDHIHKGQTPVMMAALRGHDSIVKELILANCDVNLRSSILFSSCYDIMANYTQIIPIVIRSIAIYWMGALVCILLPWMKLHMDVVAAVALWIGPVWSLLAVLVMSVLAFLSFHLMPESLVMRFLGTGMVAIAMINVMKLAMLAGPVAWMVSVVVIVAIPLAVRGPTVAAVSREVARRLVFLMSCMCAVLAMVFVVPEILAWSPRGVTRTEVAGVSLIIIVLVIIRKTLKEVMMVHWDLVKALIEGMILNVELFVIATSCMMIARNACLLYNSQTAQELLTTVMLLIWFLLMLRTHTTEMALYRGATGFIVFESMKLWKVNIALVSPDELHLVLVLVVLALLSLVALTEILRDMAKTAELLKEVMVVRLLHCAVAVVEASLALLISKTGPELWIGKVNLGEFVNLTVLLVMVLSIKANNVTALHYAARYSRIECGVFLVEGGADMWANDVHFRKPIIIGSKTFVDEVQKVLSFTTKRVIAVIGNSECGKSTLVAALERTSNIPWKKAINYFRKVHDIRQRTAGIEAVPLSNQKYGEALFYDFAGQSQYHGPHQTFLEAMLSKPEVSVTLLLLVKATEEEDSIKQQLYRWLQPLAQRSTSVTPHVIVIGSFFDQVKSVKKAREKLLRCTQVVKQELPLNIHTSCLLDCRYPESRAISQICRFLQDAPPVNTRSLSYNLHWVLVQVRKAFSTPALRLHEFQTWMQDNAVNLPRNLPSPEEVCQDLSAAGHTLFLTNKRDPSQSWLVLDLQTLLHKVYGNLFSGSQGKVNQFGLLHCSQLAERFPELDLVMLQEVLISLDFCIKVDPLLLKEELSQLIIDKGGEGWLYFPALVSARPCKVFPEDPDPNQFRWMCWQLRTAEKHLISAHLLQTIILRLAANHVFIQELSPTVRQHCCSVWVNGLSWSSTEGVDVAVQISHDSSVVQVVGRSKAGPERLQEYTAAVVQDVIKTIDEQSPKLKATFYIVHPYTPTLLEDPKAPQPDSLYLVSTITRCISRGHDYTLSMSRSTSSVHISQLFGGELPSLSTVQCLTYSREAQSGSSKPSLDPLLSTPTLSQLNGRVVRRVAAQWYEVGVSLEVESSVLDTIQADNPHSVRRACCAMFSEWLSRGSGTGEQPRVWQSVLTAVRETVGERIAEEVKGEILLN